MPGALHCGAHFAIRLESFKNGTNGKWPPSEFLIDFKSSEVSTLIWGHFGVPVYYLREHSLSQFQMRIWNLAKPTIYHRSDYDILIYRYWHDRPTIS